MARAHGGAVIVLLVLTVALRFRFQNLRNDLVRRRIIIVLVAMVAQAAIGYTQYFTELPVLLVGFHIAGATILWISVVRLTLATGAPRLRRG